MRALAASWRSLRTYATDRKSRLGPALSLDHFLQRTRVLSFYRHIIRSTRRISDPKTRAETRKFARDEFERHRGVTDLVSSPVPDYAPGPVLTWKRAISGISCRQARPSGIAWRGTLTACETRSDPTARPQLAFLFPVTPNL
ncbi:uncharacterized protein B0H64DRAFT_408304 [Chaetomium fimeti]|uniref:LYR motif-containing protein 2 n=1 Tax=Chaetomium fimeti TaxID=1854472 RepID=A0AAE0H8N6_9PEZI|nr:hypothetical protein B0H64DRAFT_408304 [Chaetomium fimeti]